MQRTVCYGSLGKLSEKRVTICITQTSAASGSSVIRFSTSSKSISLSLNVLVVKEKYTHTE